MPKGTCWLWTYLQTTDTFTLNRVLIDIFQLWQVYLTRSSDNLLLKHWVLFRDFRTSLAEFVETRNRYSGLKVDVFLTLTRP